MLVLKTLPMCAVCLCRYTVAPARAYVESVDELFAMRNAGFVKAGAENLFLIAAGDRW